MTVMVNDCYEAPDQKIFHEGLGKLDDASKAKKWKILYGKHPPTKA